MGKAGVTVFAAVFAPAVGIDRPVEGNTLRIAVVQPLTGRESAVFNPAFLGDEMSLGSKPRNPDECDQLFHESSLSWIYSPFIRLMSRREKRNHALLPKPI